MVDENFAQLYLGLLVALLAIFAFLILRQIIKNRRVEGRLSRLQNKIKKEQGTAQDYYELGGIFLDKKLYAQAIIQFQQALKLSAGEDTEPQNLALVYNALGFAYFAQDQYDLAIRHYKEALKLMPEYGTALNNLGHTYEKKKLTTQALEVYEEALKYDAENSTAKRRAESLRKRVAV
ncbi:MAG: tetratricopeptide repeat protein [Cyanothece sp. SIO1E1]|nr:tetratricopeptide repeat protein [Cyanothece sp. SIO1E1]